MPTVSLQRQNTYALESLRLAIAKSLEPWGGISHWIKPGMRVLLKPNLLTGARPQAECTTRPEIVQVVAELVRAAGGEPFIGDSPAFGSARGVAAQIGLLAVCQDLDLPLVEFHGERYTAPDTSREFAHLRLSREALGADVVINLPKVKSHMQLTLTLAVKNLFGCVPGKLKAWWHMEAGKDPERFATMLVETAQAINPQLTLVDGIIGHEGNGPSGGTPRPLGVLLATDDVFAADWVLAQLLSIDPALIPVHHVATAKGLMPASWSAVDLWGEHWRGLVVRDWQLPTQMMPIDFGAPRVLRSTLKHLLTLWSEAKRLNPPLRT